MLHTSDSCRGAGMNEQRLAANVAEYYGIPLTALHFFPASILPSGRLYSHVTKMAEDTQRRGLGLPEAADPSTRSLEIQAYDQLCLPGPASQLAKPGIRRPFVGALTLELPSYADEQVLSWIAAGTPPIYSALAARRFHLQLTRST